MATSPFQPPVFAPFLVIFLVPFPQVTQFLECPTKAWAGTGGGGLPTMPHFEDEPMILEKQQIMDQQPSTLK